MREHMGAYGTTLIPDPKKVSNINSDSRLTSVYEVTKDRLEKS